MQYFPTKKITVSVDKTCNKPSSFYLIYDMNFKNQTLFHHPENYYIKILLFFSFSPDGQYIMCDFGITELLFPGITSSHIFYLYACFSSTDSTKMTVSTQRIAHSEVYKMSTAEIVHVQLPVVPYFCDKNLVNKFSQIPVECIFSIVPFSFPFFKPRLRLLPTILFSFINLIPQITEYRSSWPLTSWIRQMQYSGDANVYNLFDILFPDKEIDFSTVCEGLRRKPKKVQSLSKSSENDSTNISTILYSSPSIDDASNDEQGLTNSQLKKIVFKITRSISLELGFSYHLFSMEPSYDMTVQGNPELLVFCPSFGLKGTILTEILCNSRLYTLHGVVREEEGNFTATVYSPFTKILYDVRNGQIFPLNRQHPPLCNANEQIIMLLYAIQDVNDFFSQKVQPIAPFFARYPVVNVFECKIGQKVPPVPRKVESASLDYDEEHVYFAYDADTMPFPAIPLTEICGKTVLQFDKKDFMSPTMLIWHAKRENNDSNNASNVNASNNNNKFNFSSLIDSSQKVTKPKDDTSINLNNNINKGDIYVSFLNSNDKAFNQNNNNNSSINTSANNSVSSGKNVTIVNNNNDNEDSESESVSVSVSECETDDESDSEQNNMRSILKNLIETSLCKTYLNSTKNFDLNPFKISYVPFAHRLAKEHEIIKENPNLTFAVVQDHCIATFFNSENCEEKEISKLENSLPMNNTVCFDKDVLQYSNDYACSKYLNISFTKNKISDKYIYFVGNPLLLLINPGIHFDSIINNLKRLYKFNHVFLKQKNAWAEVKNSSDFRNAAETMKYIDLLVQLN